MTVIQMTIDGTRIGFDVLAREDATDEELTAAKGIEGLMRSIVSQAPGAKVTKDIGGDGHDKVRGK